MCISFLISSNAVVYGTGVRYIVGMDLAELTAKLQNLYTQTPDALTDTELFNHTAQIEDLTAAIHAYGMQYQAAAHQRKAYKTRGYRSDATGVSHRTRLSRATCGRHINQAHLIVNKLPKIYKAYLAGVLNTDQINLIYRYADLPPLREAAVFDQNLFINWSSKTWPEFRQNLEDWAEYNDHTDPQDQDEKDFDNRRMVWAQGLGRTMLLEINMPNDMFEQLCNIIGPVYDKFLKQEVREARAAAGLNPDEQNDDDGRFLDLVRSDKQRWLDALMTVIRAGGTVINKLLGDAAEAGIDLEPEDLDPGTGSEVIIVLDQKTAEREIARRNGETLPDLTPEDLENRRCETLSGLPLSPSTAVDYLELGHFRRMILKPNDLDFYLSRKTRFFTGPRRTGLMARDRFCQDPGCGTPANKCEADHIKEYAEGGLTLPSNGKMRCGPCHRHKTWLQARGSWIDPDNPDKNKRISDANDLADLNDLLFNDPDQLNLARLTQEPVKAR